MKLNALRGPVPSAASGLKVATVGVGKTPGQIAFNPVTKSAFVVDTNGNSVTVIGAGNSTSTIAVQDAPTDIVANPVTGNVYVMNSGSNSITAIYKNGYTINIPTWTSEYDAMALNPATNTLYVGHMNQACVTAIDLDTLYISTIPASYPGFIAIAVNAETNRIYAANMNSDANYVLAIDGTDNSASVIGVGDYPASVVVNPAANTVYVGNLQSRSTSVIDGTDNTVIATISGAGSGAGPGIVSVLDSATGTIYGYTQFKTPPVYTKNVLTAIDCATNQATEVFEPASVPSGGALAVNAVTGKIYMAPGSGNQIYVFDGKNINAAPTPITVGNSPTYLAIDEATNTVYVSNWFDNTVSVITGS